MKNIKLLITLMLSLCIFSACADNKEPAEFTFSTDGMKQVTDTAMIDKITEKMNKMVMSFYSDWSVNDEEINMSGLAFRDATQRAYYEEYGEYIWGEDMYVPVERYIEQSEKIFGFSDEQVRRLVTAGKGVYDEERDMVLAADGYGHNLSLEIKEIWSDGKLYLTVYDYGKLDFEIGEITEHYHGMAYAMENENGDIIFLANRNDMNKA